MTYSLVMRRVAAAKPKGLPMACLSTWETIGKLALAAATPTIRSFPCTILG